MEISVGRRGEAVGVVDWTDRLHDCGEMSNRVSDSFRM